MMKKLITALVVISIIVLGGFFVLLSQTGPEKAPKGEVIVDITPKSGN